MNIERVKLTARKSLPNYEHVIAEVDFQFSEGEDHGQSRDQMQSILADYIEIAAEGLKGSKDHPAPVVRQQVLLPAAKPSAPAAPAPAARPAPSVRPAAPAPAPAAAASSGSPTPEQVKRRIEFISGELTKQELSMSTFLTHYGIASIESHPVMQKPICSAKELTGLVEACKFDAT